jgi:hypothetical protein
MWEKKDDWIKYASCYGSADHTLPPERKVRSTDPLDDESKLPLADPKRVRRICDGCRVRPECIMWATDPEKPQSGVWCAGRWIPVTTVAGQKVRNALVSTLPSELQSRGEDV